MISRPLQILSFLLLLTPSCSVKEVRSGCPCLLEVDLSTADKGKGDINISTDGFNGIRNLRSLRILPTADQVFDFFRS